MKTYLVYDLQGYDTYDKEKELFIGVINIRVIAETKKEAMEKARIQHPDKPHFRCIGSTEFAIDYK